jgi:hypothetical protein
MNVTFESALALNVKQKASTGHPSHDMTKNTEMRARSPAVAMAMSFSDA